MTKLSFMGKGEHDFGPLDLILYDVCGPLSINARGSLWMIFMIWVLVSYEIQI